MRSRPYAPADREACLRVLDSNTPRFIAPDDRPAFERFLDDLPGPYLVVERDGDIVACGGWYTAEPGRGVLTWGMVDAARHRHGIGAWLLRHRIERLRAEGIRVVQANTTQLVAPFFERAGFHVCRALRDGYGPGLDRVEMELQFN